MAAVLEDDVMDESQVARLVSDVAHLQRDSADMKVDIRDGRKELGFLKAEVASLRDEMHTGFGALRHEMHVGFAALTEELVRTSLSNRIWMFSFAGGLLAVMAHGFKWI
jgi:hypothetical protein